MDDDITGLNYWRLCDELSIDQAACLVVGVDPSEKESMELKLHSPTNPKGFEAARAALGNAAESGILPANIKRSVLGARIEETKSGKEVPDDIYYPLDTNLTTIKVSDLRIWLKNRGFTAGFFFPDTNSDTPDYLNVHHKHYAPKLAAAIESWTEISSRPECLKGKSPKQALMKWLREHAHRFGLTKEDGNPNEQGIEEIAKIANWQIKGGAPKTPEA